jgi:outer membrane protein
MRKIIAAGALALTALAGAAGAEEARGKRAGDFVVGLGAVGVLPERGGRTTPDVGRPQASDSASPLLDGTYFVLPSIAFNLIAASSQHDVSTRMANGRDLALGRTWVLPPTLTMQYHPLPASRLSPYVGVGLNVSFFYGYGGTMAPGLNRLRIDTTVGPSFNVGVDYEIAPNWLVNIDAKKILMRPSLSVNSGAVTGRAELDPWVVGAALRYRF